MREHRVPLLGNGWRGHADPEKSRDPRVQAVLVGLRDLPAGAAPEPAFRAELRAQLVAIAPRLVNEGGEDTVPLPGRVRTAAATTVGAVKATGRPKPGSAPKHADHRLIGIRFGGLATLPYARIATTTICALVALVLLLGGGVVLSHNAVPGDTLYGLKRADERFELALDSSPTERASDYLRFASTRADEVQTMLDRAQSSASGQGLHAGGLSGHAQSLVRSTLSSADSDVLNAWRLLATKAVDSSSATPLAAMTAWAPQQLGRLRTIAASVGTGTLKSPVDRSVSVVSQANTRAKVLRTQVACGCLKSTPTDRLGTQPCASCAAPGKHGTGGSGSGGATGPAPAPTGAARTSAPVTRRTTVPAGQPAGHVRATNPAASATSPGQKSATTPPPPLTVNSCGVGVSLGGIKLGLNLCKTPQP